MIDILAPGQERGEERCQEHEYQCSLYAAAALQPAACSDNSSAGTFHDLHLLQLCGKSDFCNCPFMYVDLKTIKEC